MGHLEALVGRQAAEVETGEKVLTGLGREEEGRGREEGGREEDEIQ